MRFALGSTDEDLGSVGGPVGPGHETYSSGRYSVRVFHDDLPLRAASEPVRFEVKRVRRSH
jgi:hypothetical protein